MFFGALNQDTIANLIQRTANFPNRLGPIQVAGLLSTLANNEIIEETVANISANSLAELLNDPLLEHANAIFMALFSEISTIALADLTPTQSTLLPEVFGRNTTATQLTAMFNNPL